MKIVNILTFLLLLCSLHINADADPQRRMRQRQQEHRTDANIYGHIVSEGQHLSYVSIGVKGTTLGTTTDETGHYKLVHMPEGTWTLRVQTIGYKPIEKTITIERDQSLEVNFELEEDVLGLEEVVVTGDRNATSRKEAAVIVNSLTPKLLTAIQSLTLNEGLNFSPGLRMENNCQNCGFNQVRMNGMEGPYSQVLINGRPIFSGLAGVYGLELIPSNMMERVEVVRGGGSALYGSNAIAGTINLILKDPTINSYEFGINGGLNGVGMSQSGPMASDYSINANTSIVSDDHKTGMALYGFHRAHEPFDANNDGYSELTKIDNTTFGARVFHRFNLRSKLSGDFFTIKEDRRGGDRFELPKHEATIAEAVEHGITTGALTYEQYVRASDLLSIFASGQLVKRDSYYGANQSLKDYGYTEGLTFSSGAQYNARFETSNLIMGLEQRSEWLNDTKLGYADWENATLNDENEWVIPHTENTLIADQLSNTFGAFAQYTFDLSQLNVSLGARLDHYQIEDVTKQAEGKSGNVLSPRVTLKYAVSPDLRLRTSYSQGYRAPQIFDEDLHILTSGSRQVLHENDPNLKQETSHSFMVSLDYTKRVGNTTLEILAEGFHTRLQDAFVNDAGEPDAQGTIIYTRTNAEGGATVQGVNLELNVAPGKELYIRSGLTLQTSAYEEAQSFGEKRFFRTPNQYGYLTLDWSPLENWGFSASHTYTGTMLVPYLEGDANEALRKAPSFQDLGLKMRYSFQLNGARMQLFGGVKNLFNSYQKDFDSGIDRDPAYVYGPSQPRSLYVGIKIGNLVD